MQRVPEIRRPESAVPLAGPCANARVGRVEAGRGASVDWSYASWEELAGDLDRGVDAWLSPREQSELRRWRDARRRRSWLGGRLVAKRIAQVKLPGRVELPQIEILGKGFGRPAVCCNRRRTPWALTISHSERGVLAAVVDQRQGLSIGVDLTPCRAPSAGFVRLWFTADEARWLRLGNAEIRGSSLWAAKEALYKCCNAGEPFRPCECELLPGCRYRGETCHVRTLRAWWCDGQIAVLISTTSAALSSKPTATTV